MEVAFVVAPCTAFSTPSHRASIACTSGGEVRGSGGVAMKLTMKLYPNVTFQAVLLPVWAGAAGG